MRVGKEFFHGRVAHLGADPPLHEGLEVGLRGQLLHILERGQGGGRVRLLAPGLDSPCGPTVMEGGVPRVWRGLRLVQAVGALRQARGEVTFLRGLALAARPAPEKTFAHAPPPGDPPLRLPSVLMLTG